MRLTNEFTQDESMTQSKILLPLLATLLLLIFGGYAQAAGKAPKDKVLATVNGKPITAEMLNFYTQRRLADGSARRDQAGRVPNLMNDLVALEIMSQEAEMQGLQKDHTIKMLIDLTRKNLLAQELMRGYLRNHPITDAELRKAYALVKDRIYGTQYHVYHIQVATEAKARELITELKKGAEFAKLAEANSEDPTGKKGGELGWFGKGQLPDSFSAAIEKTKPGSVADEPVKSSHGWHVVRVAGTRTQPAPSFEDSRRNLEKLVRNQQLQAYVGRLRAKFKVEQPK